MSMIQKDCLGLEHQQQEGIRTEKQNTWFQQIPREDAVGQALAAFVFGKDKPGAGLEFV